jgi:hypothetical protein
MASAAFVTSALGSAPAAHATCASFWGMGNGNGCTSTFGGVAIAIGEDASATADGFFTTAVAMGFVAAAGATGPFTLAVADGKNSDASAGDVKGGDFANLAVAIGTATSSQAGSQFGGGFGNVATNIGNGNFVSAVGDLNTAFAIFSNQTAATANPGPLAIAGSIGQSKATVTKNGPGFNINGIRIGGAAAPSKTTTSVKAAALGSSKKRTTGSAAAVKHASK